MSHPSMWRLAGGAPALLGATTLATALAVAAAACDAPVPTSVGDVPRTLAAPCDAAAMPTYALVGGAWRRAGESGRGTARTLYMDGGVLRTRAPARVDGTLDLRGLTLVRAAADSATFVGLRDAGDARTVALRVTQGCVTW